MKVDWSLVPVVLAFWGGLLFIAGLAGTSDAEEFEEWTFRQNAAALAGLCGIALLVSSGLLLGVLLTCAMFRYA